MLSETWFKPSSDYCFAKIENLRNRLLDNQESIDFKDFGAGSKTGKNSQKRKISTIASGSLSKPSQCRHMFHLAKFLDAKRVVEIGTSLGISTAYLGSAIPNGTVTSLEGDPSVATLANQNLKELALSNVEIHVGEFSSLFKSIAFNDPIDLLFLDGNHQKTATIDYFNFFLAKMNPEGIIMVDDIYWSKGMSEAWHELKKHPSVKFAVDFYDYGILCLGESLDRTIDVSLVHRWAKPWALGFFAN